MGGRARAAVVLTWVMALIGPASALAVVPETEVAGANSEWYSGSLLQQSGNNCSILGGSYSETMVSAIASYGGAPSGQVVHVGDRYYASVLISIPGNPCGSGSTFVGTDVVLPRGTSVDTSAPIRCFGQPRNANTFVELTGGNWSFTFANGNTSTGPYCPTQVSGSLTGTSGAVGVGYRPLASGQLYQLFVPIKSSETLQGIGHSPTDEIRWVLSSSGTYDNTGATYVWANVFAGGNATAPYIYFARDPSVIPYWDANAGPNEHSKAEWFANLYSAGFAGSFCWELDNIPPSLTGPDVCTSFPAKWNPTVTAGPTSWQVVGDGPNGGFVPFAYTEGTAAPFSIKWTFTYNNNGQHTVFNTINFTTLPGPDTDGDGVADSQDSCPAVKGTQANGCQPPVQTDPDGDGVFGSADKCPDANGGSAQDGCPPPAEPAANPPAADPPAATPTAPVITGGVVTTPLTASLGAIKGNKLKRAALSKGVVLPVKCGLASTAVMTLSLTAKAAKKLKIPVKGKQKTVAIGSAKGTCTPAAGGKLKLKVKPALVAKLRKSRAAVPASLAVIFSRAGSKAVSINRAIKLA